MPRRHLARLTALLVLAIACSNASLLGTQALADPIPEYQEEPARAPEGILMLAADGRGNTLAKLKPNELYRSLLRGGPSPRTEFETREHFVRRQEVFQSLKSARYTLVLPRAQLLRYDMATGTFTLFVYDMRLKRSLQYYGKHRGNGYHSFSARYAGITFSRKSGGISTFRLSVDVDTAKRLRANEERLKFLAVHCPLVFRTSKRTYSHRNREYLGRGDRSEYEAKVAPCLRGSGFKGLTQMGMPQVTDPDEWFVTFAHHELLFDLGDRDAYVEVVLDKETWRAVKAD